MNDNPYKNHVHDHGVFLITGSQGLLGKRFTRMLAKKFPCCMIFAAARKLDGDKYSDCKNVKIIYGDLRESDFWKKLSVNITHVFHLAAFIPWNIENRYDFKISRDNLMPLELLIDQGQKWKNLKQIIYSSTISIFGKRNQPLDEESDKMPDNIYSASKLAGEELLFCLQAIGVNIVSLRYSSLYDKGQYPGTVLPKMINDAIKKSEITVFGGGNRVQDFLHCYDASIANILSYQKQAKGAFNIGAGQSVKMSELAQMISRIFTKNKTKIINVYDKENKDDGYRIDISKAKKELNYTPSLLIEDGLKKLKIDMGL